MKSCQKMKKIIFTHFRQKRKTLDKRNVLGTFFRPESQKRDFSTFGSKKVKMSSFYASGALLAPKTLQNGKVGPKAEKALLGVLGSKNVPRTLRLSLFCARSENDAFLCFAHFRVFSLFGRKISFWPPKVVQNAKNAEIPSFCAFLRKWPPKHIKKYCLEQHFWPMPGLSVLERKERKSAFWGAKVRKTHFSALFGSKSQKSHIWSEK